MVTKRTGFTRTYTANSVTTNINGVRNDIYDQLKTYATSAGFTVAEGTVNALAYFTFKPPVASKIASDTPKYYVMQRATGGDVDVGAWSGDSFVDAVNIPAAAVTAYPQQGTPQVTYPQVGTASYVVPAVGEPFLPMVYPASSVIGATGLTLIPLSNLDDDSLQITIPFDFYFNGVNYGNGANGGVWLSSNGYVNFGGSVTGTYPYGLTLGAVQTNLTVIGNAILYGAGDRYMFAAYSGADGANYRVYVEAGGFWQDASANRFYELTFKPDNSIQIDLGAWAVSTNAASQAEWWGILKSGVLDESFILEADKKVGLVGTSNGTVWTLDPAPEANPSYVAEYTVPASPDYVAEYTVPASTDYIAAESATLFDHTFKGSANLSTVFTAQAFTNNSFEIVLPFDFFFNGTNYGQGLNGGLHLSNSSNFIFGATTFNDSITDYDAYFFDAILVNNIRGKLINLYKGPWGANGYRVYVEMNKSYSGSGVNKTYQITFYNDNTFEICIKTLSSYDYDVAGVMYMGRIVTCMDQTPNKYVLTYTPKAAPEPADVKGLDHVLSVAPLQTSCRTTPSQVGFSATGLFRASFDATVGDFWCSAGTVWTYLAPFSRSVEDQCVTEVCRYGHMNLNYGTYAVKVPWMVTYDGVPRRGDAYELLVFNVIGVTSKVGGYSTTYSSTDYGITKIASPAYVIGLHMNSPFFLPVKFGDLMFGNLINVAGISFANGEIYKNTHIAIVATNFNWALLPIPAAGLTALADF